MTAVELLGEDLDAAAAPRSVSIGLDRELDLSRGDVLCRVGEAPAPARELTATRLLDARAPAAPRRPAAAQARRPHDPRDRRRDPRASRARDADARCPRPTGWASTTSGTSRLRVADPLVADPYSECRETGAFVLIDDQDHATLAAGMIISAG